MRIFLWLLLFVLPISIWGQTDSLKNALKQQSIHDSQQVKIYLALSKAYWYEQLDSAERYGNLAYQLAAKLNSPEDIANTLMNQSVFLINAGKIKEATEQLEQARKIIFQYGYKVSEATLYDVTANIFRNGDPDSALACYQKSIRIAEEAHLTEQVVKTKIHISRILMNQKRHQELAALYDTLIPILEQMNDEDGLMETYTYMALAFRDLGKKEKALSYAGKALELTEKSKNKRLKSFVLGAVSSGIVSYLETFGKAEPLMLESIQLAEEVNDSHLIRNARKRLAILYYNNDNFKKASLIVDDMLSGTKDPDIFDLKARLLSEDKNYADAFQYYDKAISLYREDKAYAQQRGTLIAKIYDKLAFLNEDDLVNDFDALDSLNTIINNNESRKQFFALETKYRTAEKEAEIHKKNFELEKAKNRTVLILIFMLFSIGTGIFIIWYMRSRQTRKELEYKNSLFELQDTLNSVELANLNNQLNPHEIKNLITSIAPELIHKAPDAYKKMIKLLNVTRASLSNKLTEPLSVQVKQVDDYLQLQQTISPCSWSFEIKNNAGTLEIELPRLLLKNLAENAVKHGMKSLKEGGRIEMIISKEAFFLIVQVRDNGRVWEQGKPSDSTGIGISTYEKLFDFSNSINELKASLLLTRKGKWTEAEVLLPLNFNYKYNI